MLILVCLTRTHLERRMVINVCSLEGQTSPAGNNRTNVAGGGAYYVTTGHQGWLKHQFDPPPMSYPYANADDVTVRERSMCVDVFYLDQ